MTELDPRVYFAAERTLLAWVRTGVTVIGLGFVVARFGLFLTLVQAERPDSAKTEFSGMLGTLLVIAGGLFTGVAAVQFALFVRTLTPADRPPSRLAAAPALVVAFSVSAVGLLLAIVLLG